MNKILPILSLLLISSVSFAAKHLTITDMTKKGVQIKIQIGDRVLKSVETNGSGDVKMVDVDGATGKVYVYVQAKENTDKKENEDTKIGCSKISDKDFEEVKDDSFNVKIEDEKVFSDYFGYLKNTYSVVFNDEGNNRVKASSSTAAAASSSTAASGSYRVYAGEHTHTDTHFPGFIGH